ncbi:MAG TPA: hypothetical protein VMG82_11800 [Candidatus Sulfotelmatobacter sp.]|nr:hypothetical protein [Candidatus Sulfotelmatobacter sp.]
MKWIGYLAACFLVATTMTGQTYPGTYPETEIANGALRVTIYVPDAEKGFYRGMRFDWAGVIANAEYKGHSYFGPFFEKFDPSVSDVEIGNPVVAGIASAASGPVEEFIGADETALGYADARPGEAFCKIGVGALRKIDDTPYSSYVNYPIVNGGKRSVKSGPDWIEFTQQVDCGSGYGYDYTKTIRLAKGEPVMTIEHHLVNRGSKAIETRVYDHNFLVIDHQGAGPAIEITFSFLPKPTKPLDPLAEVRGKQLLFPKSLKGTDTFYGEFAGFGRTAEDYNIRVENRTTGARIEITGDRPLVNLGVWAVRTVVAPEPYIELKITSGRDFNWKYTYRFSVR